MALVNPREVLSKAFGGGYAVGAFNVNNMELLQAITATCDAHRSPVILQASAGARKYAGAVYIRKLVEAAAETTSIPIVLHLDHGPDLATAMDCIESGFTSVMIDGSHLPFEENIALTRKVVEYAHGRDVWVEAEFGRLEGVEDEVRVASGHGSYTDPAQAEEFVSRSGCDSLAVAIGTSHGAYKFAGDPTLDLERLAAIHARLPETPLVLHGASSVHEDLVEAVNRHGGRLEGGKGVPLELIAAAAGHGVAKVNVDTDLRLAFTGAIRKVFHEKPAEFDPRKYLGQARDAVSELVLRKVRAFGCAGMA